MRLAKYLAHAGVASRRASERLIAEGRVTVAGEVVYDPAKDVDGSSVEMCVDGEQLRAPPKRAVYALHKPVGVLSTAHDPFDRPVVVSLVPDERRRLYPVGRLDLDSSGLILLTDDGALAHALTHPSFEVEKTYRVLVGGGRLGAQELRVLRQGVELEDGRTAPAKVRRLQEADRRSRPADRELLEITIHEGRNRQVRRMCDAVGHPVLSLQRVAFGSVALGDLGPGAHRLLGKSEVEALRRAASTRRGALRESPR